MVVCTCTNVWRKVGKKHIREWSINSHRGWHVANGIRTAGHTELSFRARAIGSGVPAAGEVLLPANGSHVVAVGTCWASCRTHKRTNGRGREAPTAASARVLSERARRNRSSSGDKRSAFRARRDTRIPHTPPQGALLQDTAPLIVPKRRSSFINLFASSRHPIVVPPDVAEILNKIFKIIKQLFMYQAI